MISPVPGTSPLDIDAAASGPFGETSALRALAYLQVATADALAGFEKMVEKAEPEFRPIAIKFRDLHASQLRELISLVVKAGGEADADGSFMATVNKMVIATRALFDEIDDDVMDSVRNGEEHVLSAFDGAIADPVDEATDARVQHLRGDLVALLSATSHID